MVDQKLVLDYIKIPYIVFNEHYYYYKHLEEDLISEGLLGLCIATEKYDKNLCSKFSAFAFMYVKYYMGSYIKKYKHYERSCEDISLLEESEQIEQLYQEYKLNDYIKQLPKKDRFVLHELFWNEKDINSVAESTGYSRNGVFFRKKEIFKKLKKLMNGEKLTISEKYEKSYGELAKELGMKYSTFVEKRKKKGGEEYLMVRIGLKNILKDLKRK